MGLKGSVHRLFSAPFSLYKNRFNRVFSMQHHPLSISLLERERNRIEKSILDAQIQFDRSDVPYVPLNVSGNNVDEHPILSFIRDEESKLKDVNCQLFSLRR